MLLASATSSKIRQTADERTHAGIEAPIATAHDHRFQRSEAAVAPPRQNTPFVGYRAPSSRARSFAMFASDLPAARESSRDASVQSGCRDRVAREVDPVLVASDQWGSEILGGSAGAPGRGATNEPCVRGSLPPAGHPPLDELVTDLPVHRYATDPSAPDRSRRHPSSARAFEPRLRRRSPPPSASPSGRTTNAICSRPATSLMIQEFSGILWLSFVLNIESSLNVRMTLSMTPIGELVDGLLLPFGERRVELDPSRREPRWTRLSSTLRPTTLFTAGRLHDETCPPLPAHLGHGRRELHGHATRVVLDEVAETAADELVVVVRPKTDSVRRRHVLEAACLVHLAHLVADDASKLRRLRDRRWMRRDLVPFSPRRSASALRSCLPWHGTAGPLRGSPFARRCRGPRPCGSARAGGSARRRRRAAGSSWFCPVKPGRAVIDPVGTRSWFGRRPGRQPRGRRTISPAACNRLAAVRPAMPAPMMITSRGVAADGHRHPAGTGNVDTAGGAGGVRKGGGDRAAAPWGPRREAARTLSRARASAGSNASHEHVRTIFLARVTFSSPPTTRTGPAAAEHRLMPPHPRSRPKGSEKGFEMCRAVKPRHSGGRGILVGRRRPALPCTGGGLLGMVSDRTGRRQTARSGCHASAQRPPVEIATTASSACRRRVSGGRDREQERDAPCPPAQRRAGADDQRGRGDRRHPDPPVRQLDARHRAPQSEPEPDPHDAVQRHPKQPRDPVHDRIMPVRNPLVGTVRKA